MIETTIIQYLTAKSLRVYAEEPAETVLMPYYVVQKTAGGETEHVRRATVAVQSYGSTLLDAATANSAVINAMLDMIELDAVAAISLNSDYNFTDTATKRYRYQAVFDITYYEEATQ